MAKRILLALLPLLVAAKGDAPLVLGGARTVPATVHGTSAALHVDPAGSSLPVFNSDFAERAGFKKGWIGIGALVGPVRVNGNSAVLRYDLGRGEFKRRTSWFPAKRAIEDADGVIGPGGIPDPVVRFEMRPPMAGERTVTLPLADFSWSGMGFELALGGEKARVQFSLDRDRTLVSAAAGAAIAEAHDGNFDRAAEKALIDFDVERPVRHMALGTPLTIGPFAIQGVMVRTGDFGSAASIADADAPAADPDEIVVTGEKKQKARLRIEVGRDYLDRCSSITFDKPAKQLIFSCR